MKVRIDIDKSLTEDEVIIKCREVNEVVNQIQKKLVDITEGAPFIIFYQGNKEYYLNPNQILFFETENNNTHAHTGNDSYLAKYRLYELEEILPKSFVRISKSTIVNIKHVLSISSSFGTSHLIEFNKSHKQVYISRRYLKILKDRLEERRNYEN